MLTRRTAIGGIVGVGLAAAGGALFPSLASATTTYVITNCNTSVNVRSGPGTNNRKVGDIAKGSTFTGEQSGAWVKITSGQFNGSWVSSTYAKPTSSGAPAASSGAFLIGNCNTAVNLRTGPGTNYSKAGSIAKGSTFTGEQSGAWVKITSGPANGRWVSSTYAIATGGTSGGTAQPQPASPYTTAITAVSGGVSIKTGWNGTRVYLIRKHFGTDAPTSKGGTYDADTQRRVVALQRSKGLAPDGVVGSKTWPHFNTGRAFNIDAFQVQPQLPLSASAEQRREKMIEFALAQRGSRYCWGGAGPYELGYDCSGLVLQALYAAGLDPQPISVVKHAEPSYRTSRELYASSKMETIPASQRRRGDLIFFMDRSNTVVHVAIDLGDGTMMESYNDVAGTRNVVASYGASHMAPNVKRPF